MNLLLLEPGESGALIPPQDRRHEHLRRILKKGVGDSVDAGLVTDSAFGPAPGSLGRATIRKLDREGLILDYEAKAEAPALAPLRLLLGFPRPIQAGRIFKDLVSLGLGSIILTGTELGEKSYLESSFFRGAEYGRPLLEGAEQAANPRLPAVSLHWTLPRCLASLEDDAMGDSIWRGGLLVALHPGPSAPSLGAFLRAAMMEGSGCQDSLALASGQRSLTLAVGSERGWTEAELGLLEDAGFRICGLGERILKTETACVAASALALGALGRM